MKILGSHINEKRVEKGFSIEKLAELALISSRFLYDIENGKRGMSLPTFIRIKTALDCSSDWLLDGCENELL
ncbi:MAG: helix-turn-helix transcriptional regulator [Oscillospiraceae bacterium]|jgi:predicted transcriptional regulator|nr:helix-turn-helix transcriptional regulator [Oscillospiraceae bacterium]